MSDHALTVVNWLQILRNSDVLESVSRRLNCNRRAMGMVRCGRYEEVFGLFDVSKIEVREGMVNAFASFYLGMVCRCRFIAQILCRPFTSLYFAEPFDIWKDQVTSAPTCLKDICKVGKR